MFYILSLLCGLLIAVQVVLNGFLSQEHGLFFSIVIIHVLALLLISVIIFFKREWPFSNRQCWYLYLGGAIGVMTIYFSNIAFARISVSAILALSLFGQSLAGLFIDQYGWLGMPKQSFRKQRIIGLLLVLGGIVVMVDSFEKLAVTLAFFAGVVVIIARTLNAKLAELTTVRISAFFNFLVSLIIALMALLLFGRNEVLLSQTMTGPPLQVVVSKNCPYKGLGILATPKGVVSLALVTTLPLKGLAYFIPSSRLSVSV